MAIKACIFDMDDLLIRSGKLWRAAEAALLDHIGAPWSDELALRCSGMNCFDVARTIHEAVRPAADLAECQQVMRQALIRQFADGVGEMPGACTLVRRLKGVYPMALASGSPMEAICIAIDSLGIRDCFDHVITSETVARGKPHPDVFLKAAELLGVAPADCVVFEDSLVGVMAARSAGMQCYAVPSGHHEQIAAIATRVYRSLADVEL